MTITVLTPSKQCNARDKTDRKHFHNGKSVNGHYKKPYHYDVVDTIPRQIGRDELETIEAILIEQEKSQDDFILLFESVLKETTNIRATKMYLANDIQRNVIQLDFDGTYEGANSLTIDERVAIAIELIPSLEGVGMVAHLSNKAGFKEVYPDYMALRIYVELDRPAGNKGLRTIFEPYGLGTPIGLDHTLYSNRRKHLIQRPSISGENAPLEFASRYLKKPGGKLSLEKMVKSEHYLKCLSTTKEQKKITTTLPSSQSVPTDKELSVLTEFAANGGFDRTPRHSAHFKMLAQSIWKHQNESVIVEVICENPKILGSKTRETLEEQVQSIHTQNKKYFDTDVSLKDFDYRISRNHKDLQEADLGELNSLVEDAINKDTPLGILLRSPHGSGKTMAVLPMLYELLSKKIVGREVSLAYVTGLRSITTGTTRKLQGTIKNIVCYLDENQEIRQEVIEDAQSIAIGLKSLERLNKSYDLVFVDESEDAGMWAATFDNTFHNALVQLMAHSKIFVVADADASTLTYSLASRAQEYGKHQLALIDNEGSWIQGTTATLLSKRYQAYDKIVDLTKDGKKTFVHVDYAKDTLLATTQALNKQLGDKKVVSFCSQKGCSLTLSDKYNIYGMTGLQQLCEKPEETIDYLFSKGFQVIMVSPCIQKGWRYNSLKNRFDATVGVYIYDFITAPTIVQRTQRCVGVTNHYLFIQPSNTYIDTNGYQSILEEELANSIYGGIDAIRSNPLRHNKEISNEATLVNGRHKTNIKLHFYYVWTFFGGHISHLEAKGDSQYNEIKRLLKEAKKDLRLQEAQEIQNDPDRLRGLIDRFIVLTNEGHLELPNGLEDIIKLISKLSSYEHHRIDCEKVLRTLFATEEKAKEWDRFGTSYLDNRDMDEESKTERSLLNSDGGGHAKIWVLLDLINREIWNTSDKDLKDVIEWDKQRPLAIYVDDIQKTSYSGVFKNYRQFYLDRLPTLTRYKHPTTFFVKLLELVFQCKVKYGNAKDAVEVNKALIFHYMDKGIIKKTKQAFPHKNTRLVADHLRNKIMRGLHINPIEQEYLNNSGKILVVHLPEILPSKYFDLYELLQMRYQRESDKSYLREQEIEAILNV